MPGLFITPIPPNDITVEWSAQEVLVDLNGTPYLLRRLTITGPYFPERALEPFMQVAAVRSRFVRIAPDGLRADGYFDDGPPDGGDIVYGYGDTVDLIMPDVYDATQLVTLSRTGLPGNTVLPVH